MSDTNCRNCGAPVSGNRCEHCGTEYPDKVESYIQVTADCIKIGTLVADKIGRMEREFTNDIS